MSKRSAARQAQEFAEKTSELITEIRNLIIAGHHGPDETLAGLIIFYAMCLCVQSDTITDAISLSRQRQYFIEDFIRENFGWVRYPEKS